MYLIIIKYYKFGMEAKLQIDYFINNTKPGLISNLCL